MLDNALLSGLNGLRVNTERASDAALRIINANAQASEDSRASAERARQAQQSQADPAPALDNRSPVSTLPLPTEQNNLQTALVDLGQASRAYAASAAVVATGDELFAAVNEVI